MKIFKTWGVVFVAFGLCSQALADPALVFDKGGLSDEGYNHAAKSGADVWKTISGSNYTIEEVGTPSERAAKIDAIAQNGSDPIITMGFEYSYVIDELARKYPDIHFVVIDGYVDAPNVLSINFREHEAAYLLGILAAINSKSGKIGFVGGMDIPLIRKFSCGYLQGARSVNPEIALVQNFIGANDQAWRNQDAGYKIANTQISQGADVVFHAAGASGLGVLKAAAESSGFGMGSDGDQNGLYPGKVLTSLLKHVDVAVEQALTRASNGSLEGGQISLGLAEKGVDYSLDQYNKPVVTPPMREKLEEAKYNIIQGQISVHNYESDTHCPVE